jgi:hypothetical protein
MARNQDDEVEVVVSKTARRNFMARRKRLARKARQGHPNRKIAWIGGVLYFVDKETPVIVPNVKPVPRFGKEAVGWKPTEWRKRPSDYEPPSHRTSARSWFSSW